VTEHLGDDAELYPLGVLDDDAARDVERHIAGCTICAARVSQAGITAASLASTLPAAEPSAALDGRIRDAARTPQARATNARRSRPNFLGLALAALFALAFIGLGWKTLALRGQLDADDLALVTVVHSHFNHVSMSPQSANPVAAKVLYARDGSWIYIIADTPGGTLRAVAHAGSQTIDLGTLSGSGRTATLLFHPAARIDSLSLERDGTDVASAALVYTVAR
jgi:hypothetical protein